MGKKGEININVDIDVDDIIYLIDDDVIIQEVKDRELYDELEDWLMDAPEDDLLHALCGKLSLTKADALRGAYYTIKDGEFENRNLS